MTEEQGAVNAVSKLRKRALQDLDDELNGRNVDCNARAANIAWFKIEPLAATLALETLHALVHAKEAWASVLASAEP